MRLFSCCSSHAISVLSLISEKTVEGSGNTEDQKRFHLRACSSSRPITACTRLQRLGTIIWRIYYKERFILDLSLTFDTNCPSPTGHRRATESILFPFFLFPFPFPFLPLPLYLPSFIGREWWKNHQMYHAVKMISEDKVGSFQLCCNSRYLIASGNPNTRLLIQQRTKIKFIIHTLLYT